MASAELRDELNCSICLSLYTDPVSLRCGHNFCSPCIVNVLDTQEAAGAYSCPDCRAEYPERPALEKNRKLGNIVECFLSTQPDMEETRIFCPYCTKSRVPAVKSCLQCEISLCHEHLVAHNKSVNHSLVEPAVSFESRKCSKHKEILKYYCPIDDACICVSCWVAGDHKGHDVDLLDVASEKKKEKLRSDIDKLNSKKEEARKRIQNLKDHGKEQQEKAAELAKRVSGLFIDLREKMDNLEKRIQDEISKQKDQVSLTVSTLVLEMELHKDELTKIINQLEGVRNISDPLTFLQEDLYSDDISDKSCDVISDVRDAQCLDEVIISLTLQKELLSFSDYMINLKKREFTVTENSDILLDIDTTHYNMMSQNLRSASQPATLQNRPDEPKRLNSFQVLSSRSFSSGRHYWKVDVSKAEIWIIGVTGESFERRGQGNKCYIGCNERSWAVKFLQNCFASHNNIHKQLVLDSFVKALGIYLDYEAGRLSFYQLSDPIRHLHTFTASFTGPLFLRFCGARIPPSES